MAKTIYFEEIVSQNLPFAEDEFYTIPIDREEDISGSERILRLFLTEIIDEIGCIRSRQIVSITFPLREKQITKSIERLSPDEITVQIRDADDTFRKTRIRYSAYALLSRSTSESIGECVTFEVIPAIALSSRMWYTKTERNALVKSIYE